TIPVRVSVIDAVVAITAGHDVSHGMAARLDGTVWTWGANNYGQLGIGSADLNAHPTPVQVRNSSGIVAVAAGSNDSMALRSDGTVWCWGENDWGELGSGVFTTTGSYGIAVPVQVIGPDG